MQPTRTLIGPILALTLAMAGLASTAVTFAQQPARRLNRIIERYEQGKPALVNTDWDWIEMEVGIWDIADLRARLAALKKGPDAPERTPVLRIPIDGNEPFQWIVKQALQLGLSTIVVPQVETREQAASLVAAMRYPQPLDSKFPKPQGVRSAGAPLATTYWGVTGAEYSKRADVWPLNPEGEMLALVMIESPEAVEHVAEILSVPGLGGIMVGPADLRADFAGRLPKEQVAAAVEAAVQKALKACLAARPKICAIPGVAPADREKRAREGWHMIHGNFPPA